MSQQLGTLDICCEAPDYAIVTACRQAGFRSPEDVRWQRLTDLQEPSVFVAGVVELLRQLSGIQHSSLVCRCGQSLPMKKRYEFIYNSGRQCAYILTQCQRCRTIFWDASHA